MPICADMNNCLSIWERQASPQVPTGHLNHHFNGFCSCDFINTLIPFYWSFLEKGFSLPKNIDRIFFAEDAPLAHEFDA